MFCHGGAHAQSSEPPPASLGITLTITGKTSVNFLSWPDTKLLAAFPTNVCASLRSHFSAILHLKERKLCWFLFSAGRGEASRTNTITNYQGQHQTDTAPPAGLGSGGGETNILFLFRFVHINNHNYGEAARGLQ